MVTHLVVSRFFLLGESLTLCHSKSDRNEIWQESSASEKIYIDGVGFAI